MAIRTKRWTRLEYERLIDLGAFGPEDRLELLGGQLVVREPQGHLHSTGIRLVARALRTAFGPSWNIDAQLPVSLDEESEPEPDVAVVAGGPRDYGASHPTPPAPPGSGGRGRSGEHRARPRREGQPVREIWPRGLLDRQSGGQRAESVPPARGGSRRPLPPPPSTRGPLEARPPGGSLFGPHRRDPRRGPVAIGPGASRAVV